MDDSSLLEGSVEGPTDLEDLCNRLLLTELEVEEIQANVHEVNEVINWGEHCLLLKLLSNHYFNHEAFKTTMGRFGILPNHFASLRWYSD